MGSPALTAATDLESGQGLVGVRDAASLRKLAEWPTQGIDPHELLLDADGTLLVANGGISLQPETGRRKLNLDRMDSSLVRLETTRGELSVEAVWAAGPEGALAVPTSRDPGTLQTNLRLDNHWLLVS